MVTIVGAGPAGTIAALSALENGAAVTIHEKSRLPRHKVCGEFLSPEFAAVVESLGAWDHLLAAGAVPIRRLSLRIGRRVLSHRLSEPAYGLSRHSMDTILLAAASRRGALVRREKLTAPPSPAVWAAGRRSTVDSQAGERLFGFKAHFDGPALDAVELHFFSGCYVGVSPVEGGKTNICGLSPLRVLRELEFKPDRLLELSQSLRERVAPLRRSFPWINTGPLSYGHAPPSTMPPNVYPAGDALVFIDPFTGAGMTIAAITGRLAGLAAARRDPLARHLRQSERVLKRTLRTAGLLRKILASGWAEPLSVLAPASLLFRATRPNPVLAL